MTTLARIQQGASYPSLLVQLDFAAPSAKTIRLSSRTPGGDTKDGHVWEPFITAAEPIVASIDYMGPGADMVSCSITVVNQRLAFQPSGQRFTSLLSTYYAQGAIVTMYLWDERNTAFADGLQVFKGVINRYEANEQQVILYLMQGRAWNAAMPTRVVNKVDDPEAPDASLGIPYPVRYGKLTALQMRSPWASATTNIRDHEDAGAASGTVALVLVDRGTGANPVKVVAAQHACAKILDRANGMSAFMKAGDRLSPLDTTGLTETLGSGQNPSYISIADESLIAYAAVIPMDVRTTGVLPNTSLNPRRAIDVFDETSYASIDQGAAQGRLSLVLPDISSLGVIISVTASVAYIGDAGNTAKLQICPVNPNSGGVGPAIQTAGNATNTTPAILTGTWDSANYTSAWQFGDVAGISDPRDARVDFAGGATNKAKIIWAVLVVKYRPQRSLVIPSVFTPSIIPINIGGDPYAYAPNVGPIRPSGSPNIIGRTPPSIYQLDGQFYGNMEGYADDGSGSYSGSAGVVIERPPDIGRHLLVTYGGLDKTNDFEMGTNVFGSFADARARLRNAQDTDFVMGVDIQSLTRVSDSLKAIAAQSLCCVYLDRFTNKWLFHVWIRGAQRNYSRLLYWNDVDIQSIGVTSDVDAETGVRVKYFYDALTGRTAYEAFVNQTGSSQGYVDPGLTDQKLTITGGSNDRLDFKYNAGAQRNPTLTAAGYTPIALAQHVRAQMRATEAQSEVGWGFSIATGFNDKLDIRENVSHTAYVATLRAGDYTADGICIEVARALNAMGLYSTTGWVFACSYDQSANKFTVSKGGGLGIDWLSSPALAANDPTSGWHVLGLVGDVFNQSTTTFTNPRYAERFWLCAKGGTGDTITALWLTGTHAATSCGKTLGFDTSSDQVALYDNATYLRGDRQATAVAAVAQTGPKAELAIDASWIRVQASAIQLRNRVFDMLASPRCVVKFNTFTAPDLKRFQAIEFSNELDAHIPFPRGGTDGSWAGKVFIVTSVTQHLVDSWQQEVEAVEV